MMRRNLFQSLVYKNMFMAITNKMFPRKFNFNINFMKNICLVVKFCKKNHYRLIINLRYFRKRNNQLYCLQITYMTIRKCNYIFVRNSIVTIFKECFKEIPKYINTKDAVHFKKNFWNTSIYFQVIPFVNINSVKRTYSSVFNHIILASMNKIYGHSCLFDIIQWLIQVLN